MSRESRHISHCKIFWVIAGWILHEGVRPTSHTESSYIVVNHACHEHAIVGANFTRLHFDNEVILYLLNGARVLCVIIWNANH